MLYDSLLQGMINFYCLFFWFGFQRQWIKFIFGQMYVMDLSDATNMLKVEWFQTWSQRSTTGNKKFCWVIIFKIVYIQMEISNRKCKKKK